MLSLRIDTVQLFLELPLLPLLDVLPQGIFLENHLWVLEQLTDQAPYQGIQTVSAHTSRGTTLHASYSHRVLTGTAIIQIFIALADAQLVSRLHVQLTLPTAYERPQEIALRRGLIGAAGFALVPLELFLRFSKGLRTDDRWSRDGHPLLGGTWLPGIIVRVGVKFSSSLLTRHARLGAIVIPLPGINGVVEHTAHTRRMPHRVLPRPRRHLQRVQPFDNLARGQLFFDQPAKHVPHHVGLFGIDFDPWQEPSLFGDIAIAIHPVGPWEQFILPRFG